MLIIVGYLSFVVRCSYFKMQLTMIVHHTSCRDVLEICEFRSPWRLRKPRSEGQFYFNILQRRFAAEIGVSRVTKSWPCHMEPSFQRILETILTFQTSKALISAPFSHRFSIDFPIKNHQKPEKITPGAQWREEGGDLRAVRERFPVPRASKLRWLRLGLAGPMALEQLGPWKNPGISGKP